MDYNKYINKICEIDGFVGVSIVDKDNKSDFHSCYTNDNINDENISKIHHHLEQKVLDLSIKHFRFNLGKYSVFGYVEEQIKIILITQKSANLSQIKAIIDQLLNEILISL